MKYSIIINPNSKNSKAAMHALNFVKAAICKKHEIINVFFYGHAVKQAFTDDSHWNEIATTGVSLIACSTIADSLLSQNLNPSPHFNIAGLGHWIEAVLESNKRIEFA